jgi:hypothetical protein
MRKKSDFEQATDILEMRLRLIRARIEHLNARIDRHKCMHYNLHGRDFIEKQFNFLMHVECRNFDVRHYDLNKDLPYRKHVELVDKDAFDSYFSEAVEECHCTFDSYAAPKYKQEENRPTILFRNEILKKIEEEVKTGDVKMFASKHSAHASRADKATVKMQKSKHAQRKKFNDEGATIAEERKQEHANKSSDNKKPKGKRSATAGGKNAGGQLRPKRRQRHDHDSSSSSDDDDSTCSSSDSSCDSDSSSSE